VIRGMDSTRTKSTHPAAEAAATTTRSLANGARLFGGGTRDFAKKPTPQSAKADFPRFQPPVSTGGLNPADQIPRTNPADRTRRRDSAERAG